MPTVYSALDRLEEKGYVHGELGESTPERGGRAKKYFTATAAGVAALHVARAMLDRMWELAPIDLEPPAA